MINSLTGLFFSQILPTVSIEKVQYTELKNEVNVSSLSSEYIFPIDTMWEVPRENLVIGSVLGEGEFGKVVKAEYSGTAYSRMPSTVAIKMLKGKIIKLFCFYGL